MRSKFLVSWAVVVLTATACGGGGADEVSLPAQGGSIIDRAISGGASSEQLDVLVAAVDRGELSFALTAEAIGRSFDCLDAAGIDHSEVTLENGRYPSYIVYQSASLSEDETITLADACVAIHSQWIEEYFQTQPQFVEEDERLLALALPIIVTCLSEIGIVVDGQMSFDELLGIAHADEVIVHKDCVFEAFVQVGLA